MQFSKKITPGGSYSIKYEIGSLDYQISLCKKNYEYLYSVGETTLNKLIREVKDGWREGVEASRPLSDFTAPCQEKELAIATAIGGPFHVKLEYG